MSRDCPILILMLVSPAWSAHGSICFWDRTVTTTMMAVVRMVARVAVILFSSLLSSLFPQEFMEKAGLSFCFCSDYSREALSVRIVLWLLLLLFEALSLLWGWRRQRWLFPRCPPGRMKLTPVLLQVLLPSSGSHHYSSFLFRGDLAVCLSYGEPMPSLNWSQETLKPEGLDEPWWSCQSPSHICCLGNDSCEFSCPCWAAH